MKRTVGITLGIVAVIFILLPLLLAVAQGTPQQ